MNRIALLLALVPLAAQAQDAAPPAAGDPRLIAAYEKMVAFLTQQPSYDLRVTLSKSWTSDAGVAHDLGTTRFHFVLKRPRQFRLVIRPEGSETPVLVAVSDGQRITTYHPPTGLYARRPAIDPRAAIEASPVLTSAIEASLIDTLMRPDLVRIVQGRATDARLLGQVEADGKRQVDRFSLRWHEDDEELWVGPADEPLPRKLVRFTVMPDEQGNPGRQVLTTTLHWDLKSAPADELFRLDLPADAVEVRDLDAALIQGDPAMLAGKPAPELTLPGLDAAGNLTEAHLLAANNQPRLLLFWGAWSPRCREALPLLLDTIRASAGEGLTIALIHVGPDAKAARQFLDAQAALPGQATALVDTEGAAADLYHVLDVPAAFLVGPEGMVQTVLAQPEELTPEAMRAALRTLASPAQPEAP